MAKRSRRQQQLETGLDDDSDETRRRLVRSHAARHSWASRRQAALEHVHNRQRQLTANVRPADASVARPYYSQSTNEMHLPLVPDGFHDSHQVSPVPYEARYGNLMHHLVTVFSPLGWQAAGISHSEGAVWEHTMVQLNFAEPALFYVRLLFGAGDLIKHGVLKPEIKFHLTQRAVKEMNDAISDPDRRTSEALILAVSFIALYEVSFGGDLSIARLHRTAQAQMLASRGGLAALNLPDIVKHIIAWSDGMVAQTTNMPRVLGDESMTIDRWSDSQSKVMAKNWVPDMNI